MTARDSGTHDGAGERGLAALARYDATLPAWLTPARLFLLLYLFALAVNFGVLMLMGIRSAIDQLDGDEAEYVTIAHQLIDGEFILNARRTLVYPLFLAGILSVTSSLVVVQLIVSAIYSLSVPMLCWCVQRLTSARAVGMVSGLALALWPPAVFYGNSLYSESLALPVFLAALVMIPRDLDWRRAAICGLLLGLATHVRPMYLIFMPFLAPILWIEQRDLRRAVMLFLAICTAYAAVILPWSAFISTRFHQPILITANGGETLSGGLNPVLLQTRNSVTIGSGREVWVGPGKWLTVATNGYLSEAEQQLPYEAQDALLRKRTLEWAAANPGSAAYLELSKLGYMWGVVAFSKNSLSQRLAGNIPLLLLVLAAIIAWVRSRDLRAPLARLWVLPFFVSLVALISWGSWRFRQPADAGLIAFVVIAVLSSRWALAQLSRLSR